MCLADNAHITRRHTQKCSMSGRLNLTTSGKHQTKTSAANPCLSIRGSCTNWRNKLDNLSRSRKLQITKFMPSTDNLKISLEHNMPIWVKTSLSTTLSTKLSPTRNFMEQFSTHLQLRETANATFSEHQGTPPSCVGSWTRLKPE